MVYCSKCGAEIDESAEFCPQCGERQQAVQPAQAAPRSNDDSGSVGWFFLGFFIPIAGLILWLVWKDEKPKNARMNGLGALVSVILSIVMYVVIFGLLIAFGTAVDDDPVESLMMLF
jgi:drug/metabolite transporter (DMT)-like permease